MKLTDLSTIRHIQDQFDIKPDKKYGQNFLISQYTVEDIADLCGAGENDGILEIGPGIGTLTAELCKRYKKVVAIEIDKKLLPVLEYTLAEFDNVKIINADVLTVNLKKLLSDEFDGMNVTVCANLPYYITSPIVMNLLESEAGFENITVMIQREVAERFTATAKSGDYGAITPVIEYYAETEKILSVTPGCFYPAPKVDSAVIRMSIRKTPPVNPNDKKLMFRVIKAAFAQRRKTLVNALSAEFPQIPKDRLICAVTSCGFDERIRGEKLTLENFANLSDKMKEIILV